MKTLSILTIIALISAGWMSISHKRYGWAITDFAMAILLTITFPY